MGMEQPVQTTVTTAKRPSSDDWCRHRTEFDKAKHPVCRAGVDYHRFAPFFRNPCPCLGEAPEKCEKFEAYSAAELAAKKREVAASFRRRATIRVAIVQAHETTGANQGEMECPACKTGKVRWSRAASNGHVHAACSTPDCANWME